MSSRAKTFDFVLSLVPIILTVIGISVIYSLVLGTDNDGLATKQAIIGLIGIVIMIATSFSDYRFFKSTTWITYFISLILLALVYFFGKTTNGAMNWLDLKFFQLQPSELAKIFLIIALSSYISSYIGKITWKRIFTSFLMLTPHLILILKEPDLGTAAVIVFAYIIILLLSKPDKTKLLTISVVLLAIISIFVMAYNGMKPFDKLLAEFQKDRIAIFLHPDLDPYGSGYNVTQAKITVGSGGILGSGLGKGTQSQLQFLPEPYTDFIFAGVAESYGFIGSLFFLLLYVLFILRFIDIAGLARDNFGTLVSFGIASMFFAQLLINVGMNLGLLPVTGIPLPFVSSGGTSLLVSYFSVGIAQSIYIRHKKISF